MREADACAARPFVLRGSGRAAAPRLRHHEAIGAATPRKWSFAPGGTCAAYAAKSWAKGLGTRVLHFSLSYKLLASTSTRQFMLSGLSSSSKKDETLPLTMSTLRCSLCKLDGPSPANLTPGPLRAPALSGSHPRPSRPNRDPRRASSPTRPPTAARGRPVGRSAS